MTNKEAELNALEQKTDHMTGGLERLQSELIVAEEKEAERLSALRESEKVRGRANNGPLERLAAVECGILIRLSGSTLMLLIVDKRGC